MREDNGQPVRIPDSQKTFVPVDAICLLSGVNFGSVEKVFAAIAMLQHVTNTDIRDLASFYRTPKDRVSLSNPQHAARALAAREVVDRVTQAWASDVPATAYEAEYREDVSRVLHAENRFGGR